MYYYYLQLVPLICVSLCFIDYLFEDFILNLSL